MTAAFGLALFNVSRPWSMYAFLMLSVLLALCPGHQSGPGDMCI